MWTHATHIGWRPSVSGDNGVAPMVSQGASLGGVCGDPGLPSRQDPPLGLAGVVQRNAEQYVWHKIGCRSCRSQWALHAGPPSGLHSWFEGFTPLHMAVGSSDLLRPLAVGCLEQLLRLVVMQCKHHPLTWFSPPAEVVCRGVALGASTWEI